MDHSLSSLSLPFHFWLTLSFSFISLIIFRFFSINHSRVLSPSLIPRFLLPSFSQSHWLSISNVLLTLLTLSLILYSFLSPAQSLPRSTNPFDLCSTSLPLILHTLSLFSVFLFLTLFLLSSLSLFLNSSCISFFNLALFSQPYSPLFALTSLIPFSPNLHLSLKFSISPLYLPRSFFRKLSPDLLLANSWFLWLRKLEGSRQEQETKSHNYARTQEFNNTHTHSRHTALSHRHNNKHLFIKEKEKKNFRNVLSTWCKHHEYNSPTRAAVIKSCLIHLRKSSPPFIWRWTVITY